MLSNYIRVIHSDNGTLTDYSLKAQEKSNTITLPLVVSEDYVYIGQYLAFNNIFLEVTTANTNASVLSIELWDGNNWTAAVDVLDGTSSSGKTFAESGVIQWAVSTNGTWQQIADTSTETNSGLTSLSIYNLNWIRLKVSATLSDTTAIDRIKYCFTEDTQINALDPDMSRIMTAWSSSKTNWLDQILSASDMVAFDLKNRKMLKSINQLLRFDEVYLPTAYKTLSIIYGGLGKEYVDRRNDARAMYKDLIKNINFTVDVNNNGNVEQGEIKISSGRVYR